MIGFGQYSTSKENLILQANKASSLLLSGNYEEYVKFINTDVMEYIGGYAATLEYTKQSMGKIIQQNEIDIIIGNPTEIISHNNQLQSTFPQTLVMKNKEGRFITKYNLIAISNDNGKNWTFIDTGGKDIQSMLKDFPKLSSKLILPPKEIDFDNLEENNYQEIDIIFDKQVYHTKELENGKGLMRLRLHKDNTVSFLDFSKLEETPIRTEWTSESFNSCCTPTEINTSFSSSDNYPISCNHIDYKWSISSDSKINITLIIYRESGLVFKRTLQLSTGVISKAMYNHYSPYSGEKHHQTEMGIVTHSKGKRFFPFLE